MFSPAQGPNEAARDDSSVRMMQDAPVAGLAAPLGDKSTILRGFVPVVEAQDERTEDCPVFMV